MTRKQTVTKYAAIVILLVCTIANPLEQISPLLKWVDELLCLSACLWGVILFSSKTDLRKELPKHLLYFIPFFIFMFMQLLGTILYQFQPLSAVVIDALTNAKFWLALYGCYLGSRTVDGESVDKGLLLGTKVISVVLLGCFLIERTELGFSGADYTPFGIPYTKLFYVHTTYLAAALVMLLAILMSQWTTKLIPFAAVDLLMLIFTFRSKAYGGAVAFVGLLVFVVLWKQKLRLWQVCTAGLAMIAVAWEKIKFYFITLGDISARSVMLKTSFVLMKEYFPFGTGYATFASHQAGSQYSPLYYMYGISEHHELGLVRKDFLDDHFWPIIFAQSGFIGTLAFVGILFCLLKQIWKIYSINYKYYASSLFCVAYLLISSTSEPAFNNSVAMPLALLLGYWLKQANQVKPKEGFSL